MEQARLARQQRFIGEDRKARPEIARKRRILAESQNQERNKETVKDTAKEVTKQPTLTWHQGCDPHYELQKRHPKAWSEYELWEEKEARRERREEKEARREQANWEDI